MDKSRANRPVLIVFVLIVVLSIFMMKSFNDQSEQTDIPEQQLAKILSEMEDVGQVFVYFHYEQQKEKQFLAVTQQQSIVGVIIVAQGAQDVQVQRLLKQTVGNVLQIPTHRIQVVAMQHKEEAK